MQVDDRIGAGERKATHHVKIVADHQRPALEHQVSGQALDGPDHGQDGLIEAGQPAVALVGERIRPEGDDDLAARDCRAQRGRHAGQAAVRFPKL